MRALAWGAGFERAKRGFLAALALLALAAARVDGDAAAQPVDGLDWRRAPNALGLELTVAPGEGVAIFHWRIAEADGPVVCRLDADGDGVFDHELLDCHARKELQHRFARSGVYFATLVAQGVEGQAGLARAQVAVAAE